MERGLTVVFLPATRGAEVLYANVIRPAVGNVKARTQSSTSSNPFQKTEGFSTAGTTAPSSFERELPKSPTGPQLTW